MFKKFNFKLDGDFSKLGKLVGITMGLGILVFAAMFFIVLSVFGRKGDYKPNGQEQIKVETESGNKVSVLGLIQKIDVPNKVIEITNIDKPEEEDIKLNLANYTEIKDTNGDLMVIAEVELGDIADITYAEDTKKAEKVYLSQKAWTNENVKQFTIDQNEKTIKVADKTYSYNNKLVKVYKTDKITFEDIASDSVINVIGYKDMVWGIKVMKYYGYLTFANFEKYIGNDIEVDSKIFKKIDVNNKILLEPGEHKVVIKGDFIEDQVKNIVVNEKETTAIDLSDIEEKRGVINFKVNVDDYKINIYNDAKTYDTDFSGKQISVPYGKYTVVATKSGYDTVKVTINVKTPITNVNVLLKKIGEGAKVKITANVKKNEVYIDDQYIGSAPLDTTLEYGNHKIAVRSQGYLPAIKHVNIKNSEENYDFNLLLDNPYSNHNSDTADGDVYVGSQG